MKLRGYTLVELIVSLGLFAIVITLATGAYFVILGVNRYAQATATSVNNFAFALEKMTRSIRTGSEYRLSGDEFSFKDTTNGRTVTFRLNEVDSKGVIQEAKNPAGGISFVNITDKNIDVDTLIFDLEGEAPGDTTQSRVTIFISGTIDAGRGVSVPFSVQTGATMRVPDV